MTFDTEVELFVYWLLRTYFLPLIRDFDHKINHETGSLFNRLSPVQSCSCLFRIKYGTLPKGMKPQRLEITA